MISTRRPSRGSLKFMLKKRAARPEAEKQAWRAALPDFFDEWIDAIAARGNGEDAHKTVRIWREVVEQHR